MMVLATLFLAIGVFVLDLLMPLGASGWGPYLIPLLISFRVRKWWYPIFLSLLCSLLLVIGYFFSVPSGLSFNFVAINRLVGIGMLWITALLLVKRKQADEALLKQVERELALRNERLSLIARIGGIVGAPMEEQGCKLAELARTAFGVDGCVIRVLEGDDLVLFGSAGGVEGYLEPCVSKDWGLGRRIFEERKPVFVPDLSQNPMSVPFINRLPTGALYRSYAGAPLLAQNETLGLIGIYSQKELQSFRDADLEHLQIVANNIATSIYNERLYKKVRNQKDELAEQITERKRTEEALRQSEERFRIISEQSLMGIYIIQGERFKYANPKFAEMFGYDVSGMLSLSSVFDVIVEKERPIVSENVRLRLEGQIEGIRYRFHGQRKDAGLLTIEAHGFKAELNGEPVILGTAQDVTEREMDEAELKRTTEQLQTLSRRLLELQESERRHIARELHDEIGQGLTALKINLQAVQRMANSTAFSPRLLDSIGIVDKTLRQVRNLSLDLRPSMLDDLGLFAALRWYADQQAQRAGLRIQFAAEPMEMRQDPALETACFRVAQEALTNIVRHAEAQNVTIDLNVAEKDLQLTIRDDGIGFDMKKVREHVAAGSSLGLLGMEERASLMGGRVEFKSTPGEGTEVYAWFPISKSLSTPGTSEAII
ncbi:PAS domain S-box protein [Pedosphaera parvula]|uniref:Multi-sensor signal transduction histidine kinase n=1 Tax=Pedosphaera parvula (strain Ellin514) TaxID=320771 RepID=B9XSI9_PEDPL|nr:PAS domain S-box protein [Pedosphaera parvula]EEF57189.1 multi-sensor signal transduction histidine kinase [Pedosphaera parvula Ellin514]